LTGKTKDALNVPYHPRLRSQLLRERHLSYVHGIESKHHRIADATPPRVHSVHVSVGQEYTEPPLEHLMMGHCGEELGEGEKRERGRDVGFASRERQRDGGSI
jgi:hypothetical protein